MRSWWTSSTVQGGCQDAAHRSAAITPSAARLTDSLRDIGYDFPSAVADIVDNSIMAGASRVEILIEFDGADSCGLRRRRRLRDDRERAGRGAALRNPADLLPRGSGALRAGAEDGVAVPVPFGDRGDPQLDSRPAAMAVTDAGPRPDRRVGRVAGRRSRSATPRWHGPGNGWPRAPARS